MLREKGSPLRFEPADPYVATPPSWIRGKGHYRAFWFSSDQHILATGAVLIPLCPILEEFGCRGISAEHLGTLVVEAEVPPVPCQRFDHGVHSEDCLYLTPITPDRPRREVWSIEALRSPCRVPGTFYSRFPFSVTGAAEESAAAQHHPADVPIGTRTRVLVSPKSGMPK